MQTENASRERKPELFEIHYGFQEQGKRLQDCLSRITTIANKLEDESGIEKEAEPKGLASDIKRPGITTDLNNTIEGYKSCIIQIERQLTKIEKHI